MLSTVIASVARVRCRRLSGSVKTWLNCSIPRRSCKRASAGVDVARQNKLGDVADAPDGSGNLVGMDCIAEAQDIGVGREDGKSGCAGRRSRSRRR